MKIGFFDSGAGGLSVLRLAEKKLPGAQFLYYADSDHVPYGERSEEDVVRLVSSAVSFLCEHGAEAIVLACNTATSVAAALLRERYSIPIVGMEPAVKKALTDAPGGRVLVAATPITVRGDKLKYLIGRVDPRHLVDTLPLPELVHFAERSEFSLEITTAYLRQELSRFELTQYSSLVLGCTHFLFFTDAFRSVLPPSVRLVDGNEGTVNQLIRVTGGCSEQAPTGPRTEYFESGRCAPPETIARFQSFLARLDMLEAQAPSLS